jgi:hypothetical protein
MPIFRRKSVDCGDDMSVHLAERFCRHQHCCQHFRRTDDVIDTSTAVKGLFQPGPMTQLLA